MQGLSPNLFLRVSGEETVHREVLKCGTKINKKTTLVGLRPVCLIVHSDTIHHLIFVVWPADQEENIARGARFVQEEIVGFMIYKPLLSC